MAPATISPPYPQSKPRSRPWQVKPYAGMTAEEFLQHRAAVTREAIEDRIARLGTLMRRQYCDDVAKLQRKLATAKRELAALGR